MSTEKPAIDPFIAEQVEASLKPYLGIAPPAVLAAMRASLEAALTTHPVARGLVKQLRDHAVPKVSGDDVAAESEAKTSGGEEGT